MKSRRLASVVILCTAIGAASSRPAAGQKLLATASLGPGYLSIREVHPSGEVFASERKGPALDLGGAIGLWMFERLGLLGDVGLVGVPGEGWFRHVVAGVGVGVAVRRLPLDLSVTASLIRPWQFSRDPHESGAVPGHGWRVVVSRPIFTRATWCLSGGARGSLGTGPNPDEGPQWDYWTVSALVLIERR